MMQITEIEELVSKGFMLAPEISLLLLGEISKQKKRAEAAEAEIKEMNLINRELTVLLAGIDKK